MPPTIIKPIATNAAISNDEKIIISNLPMFSRDILLLVLILYTTVVFIKVFLFDKKYLSSKIVTQKLPRP